MGETSTRFSTLRAHLSWFGVTDSSPTSLNGFTGDFGNRNVIVTSCLQYGDLYVPFQPVPYLGKDQAETLNEPFQTKLNLLRPSAREDGQVDYLIGRKVNDCGEAGLSILVEDAHVELLLDEGVLAVNGDRVIVDGHVVDFEPAIVLGEVTYAALEHLDGVIFPNGLDCELVLEAISEFHTVARAHQID